MSTLRGWTRRPPCVAFPALAVASVRALTAIRSVCRRGQPALCARPAYGCAVRAAAVWLPAACRCSALCGPGMTPTNPRSQTHTRTARDPTVGSDVGGRLCECARVRWYSVPLYIILQRRPRGLKHAARGSSAALTRTASAVAMVLSSASLSTSGTPCPFLLTSCSGAHRLSPAVPVLPALAHAPHRSSLCVSSGSHRRLCSPAHCPLMRCRQRGKHRQHQQGDHHGQGYCTYYAPCSCETTVRCGLWPPPVGSRGLRVSRGATNACPPALFPLTPKLALPPWPGCAPPLPPHPLTLGPCLGLPTKCCVALAWRRT
jgi:hypothetical protein